LQSVDAGADVRVNLIGDDDGEQLGGSNFTDLLSGNGGNDDLSGYDGNDTIVGGTGDDRMTGGKGADTYYVDSAGDEVKETSFVADDGAVYTVHVTGLNYALGELVENLYLHGGDLNGSGNLLNNLLVGTDGANVLRGQLGDDTIVGGKGVDTLYGGGGSDTFVFNSILDSSAVLGLRDRVMEFATGVDKIDVSGIDANSQMAGDQAFVLDTDGTLALGEFSITTTAGGNTILSFNADIGSAADMVIQLNNVSNFQLTDIIL
jgi:Ca2+-binding RTX toxin-like protein